MFVFLVRMGINDESAACNVCKALLTAKPWGFFFPNELLLRELKKQSVLTWLQTCPVHHCYKSNKFLIIRTNQCLCLNSDIRCYTILNRFNDILKIQSH